MAFAPTNHGFAPKNYRAKGSCQNCGSNHIEAAQQAKFFSKKKQP